MRNVSCVLLSKSYRKDENGNILRGTNGREISDVTRIDTTDAHIGINEFKEFYKKYPGVKFYAMHRADYSTEGMDGIEFPVDGDKIII